MSKYVKFTDEEIYKAAHTDIKDFLERHGEKVKQSGTEWMWAKHDSVKIKGHVWYRFSSDDGGTAIDFLQEFYNLSFPDAVMTLLDCNPVSLTRHQENDLRKINKKKPNNSLIVPGRNNDCNRAIAYLCKSRCLNYGVVLYFIKIGLIYETLNHHNIVFAGKDKYGTIRHCTLKGTITDKPFKGEPFGSNKMYSFNYIGKSTIMYVFEAPVDLLSYISLQKTGKDWKRFTYLATCGFSRMPIDRILTEYPYITKIVFCYDNDTDKKKNRGKIAAQNFMDIYKKKGYIVEADIPPAGDWNDVLCKSKESEK